MTKINSVAGKRKNYGAEFKAKVALEAMRGELLAKHGVQPPLINTWRRQALKNMSGISSCKAEVAVKEGEIKKTYAKIGQLMVEQFFCQSLWMVSMDRRREMIEPEQTVLSITRQCALIGIRRSAWYGLVRTHSPLNLALMKQIDAQFTETPFYGRR